MRDLKRSNIASPPVSKAPVTMKDIAQALGVSIVTVSKVMREHSDIGLETRTRVLAKAKELNYRPNLSARSLVTGRTYQVGVVVPTLLHPFFTELLSALYSTMKEGGYAVMLCSSMEDPAVEEEAIEQLLAHRMDGLIVASCSDSPAQFQQLKKQGKPFVLIDRFFPSLATNFVGVDDRAIGQMATEHLIAMGCKRIAHIRGLEFTTGIGRFEGYKLALKKHRLKYDPELVSPYLTADGRDWERSFDSMRGLLDGKQHPDGVFCYNDPVAIAAMEVVQQAGLRIPQDVAFIGCDNLRYDNSLQVPLSSIDHHSAAIGVRAGKMLLRLLKNPAAKAVRQVALQPALVVRASSLRRKISK